MAENAVRPDGPKIRAIRRNAGLTQQTLAKAAGIRAKRTIERIENSDAAYVTTLAKLARALGVSTHDILLAADRPRSDATRPPQIAPAERVYENVLHHSPAAELLDVVRVLSSASRIYGRLIEVTARRCTHGNLQPRQTLELLGDVLPDILDSQDWRLRRVLGRCVGEAIRVLPDTRQEQMALDRLTELCSAADGQLVLAQISNSGDQISRRLGSTRILSALRGNHPQARWLLANHWYTTTAVLGPQTLIDTTIQLSDQWMRRGLLAQSIPHFLIESNNATERIKKRFAPLFDQELHNSGPRFTAILDSWLRARFKWSLAGVLPGESYRSLKASAEDELHVGKWQEHLMRESALDDLHEGIVVPELLRMQLEFLCLDMEMKRPSIRESSAQGRGRYAVILDRVNTALNTADNSLHDNILSTLSNAENEGIRWAVAASLGEYSSATVQPAALRQILATLTSDRHPWVIREALTTLGVLTASLLEHDSLVQFAKTCVAGMSDAVAAGWPRGELYLAFLKLCQAHPYCMELVDVQQRN